MFFVFLVYLPNEGPFKNLNKQFCRELSNEYLKKRNLRNMVPSQSERIFSVESLFRVFFQFLEHLEIKKR